MDCIFLALGGRKWGAVVKMVMNLPAS